MKERPVQKILDELEDVGIIRIIRKDNYGYIVTLSKWANGLCAYCRFYGVDMANENIYNRYEADKICGDCMGDGISIIRDRKILFDRKKIKFNFEWTDGGIGFKTNTNRWRDGRVDCGDVIIPPETETWKKSRAKPFGIKA